MFSPLKVMTKTIGGVFGGKSLKQASTDAVISEANLLERSSLSKEQNKLLQKALKKMGLSKTERVTATQSGSGSARSVIESALTTAQRLQSGSGRNG